MMVSWFLLIAGDGDRSPEVLKSIFNPCFERGLLVQRPQKESSQVPLQKLKGNLRWFQAGVYFAASLTFRDKPPDCFTALQHVSFQDLANAIAGKERGDEGPRQTGAPPWFLGEALHELAQNGVNRLLALGGTRYGFSYLAKLNFGHHAKNVVFGLAVVEECAFAHVRGFGDVIDSDVWQAALGKELKCAPKQAEAGFGGAALTAAHGFWLGLGVAAERHGAGRGSQI